MTAEERALRRAADMFHEIVSAIVSSDRLPKTPNAIVATKLRENLRTPDQIQKIAADGFELCVRALAELGAAGVTIHECGQAAFGEEP
jgi:hypothetical protein